jgi:hypothetical protein
MHMGMSRKPASPAAPGEHLRSCRNSTFSCTPESTKSAQSRVLQGAVGAWSRSNASRVRNRPCWKPTNMRIPSWMALWRKANAVSLSHPFRDDDGTKSAPSGPRSPDAVSQVRWAGSLELVTLESREFLAGDPNRTISRELLISG